MSTTTTYLTLTRPVGTERRQLSIWNSNWNAVDAAFNPNTVGAAGAQVAVLRDTAQAPSYTTPATKMVNLTPTWNHNSVHTVVFVNVTDTLSAAGALLADLQVGGVSQWKVTKGGVSTQVGGVVAPTVGPASGQQHTLPAVTSDTVVLLAATQELTGKTLTTAVGKGTWTTSGTWTLPAFTLGGTVSGGGNQINNVVIGTATPLAGTFTSVTFSTNVISTTALATPAALTATQFTGFASTVSGAAIMGYGTTNDVTLMNRAGTAVLGVTANTSNITMAGALAITGALSGVTTLTATTVAGTLSTAAQPNVTSVGTLTSLTTSGALTVSAGGVTVSAGGIVAAGATGLLTLGTTPATAGMVRIPNAAAITARNAANTQDIHLVYLDASNVMQFGENATGGAHSASNFKAGVTVSAGGATITGTLALGASNLTTTGTISATGARVTQSYHTNITSTNAVTVDSSLRSKVPESIQDYVGDALALLAGVRVVRYRHLDALDPTQRQKLGVVAETLGEPLALQDIDDPAGGAPYRGVNLMGLAALQVQAIQQLTSRLAALEHRLLPA